MNINNPPDRLFGTDAAIWLERMGFNGKQVSMAAERIGMSGRNFMRRRDGESDLTLTERLAMAAVRAGLPPWTPEVDSHLEAFSNIRKQIELMIAQKNQGVSE